MTSPLQGYTLLNTRAIHQAAPLTKYLEKHGGNVVEIPLISMKKTSDPKIKEAIKMIHTYDYIVFTSTNSISFFLEILKEQGLSKREICNMKFAVVGKSTLRSLNKEGFDADIIPPIFDAEHLASALKTELSAGEKVLYPKSDLARDVLTRELHKVGIQIDDPSVYETVFRIDDKAKLNELIKKNLIHIIIFTSPSTVHSFFSQVDKEVVMNNVDKLHFAVIGSVTSRALKDEGIEEMIIPKEFTTEALVHAIMKHIK
ncbi:uroporphyrinogen-III synthase [Evansella cellulosilytica]|uniref:Uroporphyrinogen-III synthase n=1 Tax=Evansella cellulosilytica (strain ATCC 21833 / DSM 2522 / FERM P-1141 / JCM 9156 / N-4) TaxID=649639 RepID=E6TZR4_EVAC2|nr:uroporphyrinogen-III synthase [Evansella cellulosilytica]ADU31370.1 Uroporphyrinogen III synthase HEM4 [Evansella cellulosilytica DSM 2522]